MKHEVDKIPKMIYYRPFLVLKRYHLNKPPYQIPFQLTKLGTDVTLLIGKDQTQFDHKFKVIETNIFSTSNIGNINIIQNFREIVKVLKFLNSNEADVFLFHGNFPATFAIVSVLRSIFLFRRRKTKRFILKLDWDGIFLNYRRLIRYPFALLLFLNSFLYDFMAVETTCAYNRLKFFPGFSGKLMLFPNTIPDIFFETIPTSKENNVLTVSRIVREKKLEVGICAFAKACEKFTNWTMEIVGPIQDEEYFKDLRNLISRLHLEKKVKFLGVLYGEKLKESYSRSSIFHCFPKSSFGHCFFQALFNTIFSIIIVSIINLP